ncbi:MAG: methylated-DNA--[protein]-cysteine S-methyltransferase [Armatimonadota bacterium]|nr:methylated-DNA--[protein]-cysteine S-methyltransferase [Armatimonadota bacterium]MDW8156592.1 methylated-DNA--[protein]-cysteine S-methyltransferase [Armatimonadota bacterium]
MLLVAVSPRGLRYAWLADRPGKLARLLRKAEPAAKLRRDPKLRRWAEAVRDSLFGRPHRLPMDLRGTPFQRRVWSALRRVPSGQTVTYAQLALRLGFPGAARAVARACAANPLALVVPCHRVIRSDGQLGGYRWGVRRKRVLLELEARVRRPGRPRKAGQSPSRARRANLVANSSSSAC